jgi:hypothetical protein
MRLNPKKFLLLNVWFFGVSIVWPAWSQDVKPQGFQLSAFLETFYAYDFNRPLGAQRQAGFYHHNRHNEVNINLAMLRMAFEEEKYRAVLDIQAGTYAQDNYAAEQGMLQALYQAYAGVKLGEDLWLDAGIFESHLGWESALSSKNYTLTRSLSAENSPYFLSGVRVQWQANEQLSLLGVISNGWQRIQRVPGNSLPGFGTQVVFRPSKEISFNWSTFFGTDDPDSTRRLRHFHNLYLHWQPEGKFKLIAGFDIGWQQASKGSPGMVHWLTPALIAHYRLNANWALGARSEYMQDENRVVFASPSSAPVGLQAYSFNIDRQIHKNAIWRIEARYMQNEARLFESDNGLSRENFYVTTSLAVEF